MRCITALVVCATVASIIAPVRSHAEERLVYRGFTLNISAATNFASIENSVKHQVDIVADCGVSPEIMNFFRSRRITVVPGLTAESGRSESGRFDGTSVQIDAAVQPPRRPILLHELLHALHANFLPQGTNNPDVLLYYNRAKKSQLYPANEYLLTNAKEFFAVTASLYLWGNVDREPHTRERLHALQPFYYAWLGKVFGVQKAADTLMGY